MIILTGGNNGAVTAAVAAGALLGWFEEARDGILSKMFDLRTTFNCSLCEGWNPSFSEICMSKKKVKVQGVTNSKIIIYIYIYGFYDVMFVKKANTGRYMCFFCEY